jgi:hypothetical protein
MRGQVGSAMRTGVSAALGATLGGAPKAAVVPRVPPPLAGKTKDDLVKPKAPTAPPPLKTAVTRQQLGGYAGIPYTPPRPKLRRTTASKSSNIAL